MRHAAATVATLALLTALNPARAAGEANGLIVQLRDAPTYQQLQREKAASASGRSATEERHRERLQRVLQEAAVDKAAIDVPSAPDVAQASGAAQLLRYEKRLSASQAQRLAQRLRQRPDVLWVEPNTRERLLQSNNINDPYFAASAGNPFPEGQWWLFQASGANESGKEFRRRGVPNFQNAWQRFNGTGRTPVVVAVLDTGITTHTQLVGKVLTGFDFVTDTNISNDGNGRDADPTDPGDWVSTADLSNAAFSGCDTQNSSWHGTKIAGQIAALTNDGTTVAGANWNANILPVRVAGKCGADVEDIAAGIRWAAGIAVPGATTNTTPAKIINISFGGDAECGSVYQQANTAGVCAGALVGAGAGNDHTRPRRPASCSNVVGVGALNRDGFKASYSNFGTLTISTVGGDSSSSGAQWNDFVADTGLLTLSNTGTQGPSTEGYANVVGTSFSAPVVSAAISLMWGLDGSLDRDDIINGLRLSARPHVTSNVIANCSQSNPGRCICTTDTCGVGILDVDRALQWVEEGSVASLAAVNIDANDVKNAVAFSPQDRSANPVTPSTPAGPCGRDNVCAGAMQPGWLLGLLAASAALLWQRRRRA